MRFLKGVANNMCYTARCVSAETETNYLLKNESITQRNKLVNEACEDFLACYATYLNEQEKCYTKSLIWGQCTVEEFRNTFRRRVLLASYKVWDASHLRYPELLDAVKENNPDWVERVVRDHEQKIKMCKVSVYPLEEALTA